MAVTLKRDFVQTQSVEEEFTSSVLFRLALRSVLLGFYPRAQLNAKRSASRFGHRRASQYVNKRATDCCDEARGLESHFYKSLVRVDYCRSYQFCFKWKKSMHSRRSSRTTKPSRKILQRSPSPDEEVIQRRCLSKRQRKTGLKKTKARDSVVKEKTRRDGDILDIINSTHRAKSVTEDEGDLVEVTDKGVDESDEDCGSVNSSIVSGPSIFFEVSPKNVRPSQNLCSKCQKMYQKAKKMKAPIKDKLLDNNPKSLTCDQWVLIKSWRPRRLPINLRGKLLTHLTLVKRRLCFKPGSDPTEQCVREEESSACSRPHTFLQRNLRQCVRAPVKTVKNKRKRKRDYSRSPRVAKQRHLHVGAGGDDVNSHHTASGVSSTPAPEGCGSPEMDTVTVELIPCSVRLQPLRVAPAPQKAAKKRGGFRDLLAQLRGNSSVIVRETH